MADRNPPPPPPPHTHMIFLCATDTRKTWHVLMSSFIEGKSSVCHICCVSAVQGFTPGQLARMLTYLDLRNITGTTGSPGRRLLVSALLPTTPHAPENTQHPQTNTAAADNLIGLSGTNAEPATTRGCSHARTPNEAASPSPSKMHCWTYLCGCDARTCLPSLASDLSVCCMTAGCRWKVQLTWGELTKTILSFSLAKHDLRHTGCITTILCMHQFAPSIWVRKLSS